MAKAVGIDIGSHACKVAVVDGSPKGAKLLRFVEREYEYDEHSALTPAVVLDAVRKALADAKAPKHAASLALAAEQCILREISVPFTDADQIAKVAKFEFEPHLHNAAIEDVVIDYIATGPARVGTRLLVFACLKDVLKARLEQLGQVGVDPLHVDVDVTSLFNVALASGVIEEHPNCLIIDIGARTTKTLYVQGGILKVARSIRLGSKSANKRLTADFQGDEEAAKRAMEDAAGVEALANLPVGDANTVEIVATVGAVEAAVAKARKDEFMQRVLRETQRTLPLMAGDDGLSRVFITGGGASAHPNARAQLEEKFGAPVEVLPVLAAVEHDLAPSDADAVRRSGAVALGTALKVVGLDAGAIDLRVEDFRFARTFDQVKNALAMGVTLLFFAVFLLWLSFFMESQKAGAELRGLQRVAEGELDAKVFDAYRDGVTTSRTIQINREPEKYFQTTGTGLRKIQGHLKNELGLGTEVPPIISGLETWKSVMESVKSVRDKVKFLAVKQEDYEQEKAVLTVVVGDYPDIDTITLALRKHTAEQGGTLFESVDNRAPRTVKGGYIETAIEMVLLPREAAGEQR